MPPEASARADWHAREATDVLRALESSADGLSGADARRRLERHGPNQLRPPKPASALRILTDQFRGVVVVLLVGAGIVSLGLGDRVEAAAIGAVIVLNAALGFVVELRARRAMEALLEYQAARATVLRDGRLTGIDATDLVPGDVIELSAGQTVPADGRAISATDLRTNEAALTGESLPVSKHADVVLDADAVLAERKNQVYKGTTVVAGTGRVVVTETGSETEVGRIGILAGSLREERTPLERRLDTLGHRLVWIALGVALVVAALGLVQGAPPGLMVKMAIALAVAAVPEGLPAVATIALAIGLRRMARRNALVRRLPAVEALGSTTVVCTDKTRTLTSGDMTVVRVWTAGSELALLDDSERDDAAVRRLRAALETAALASRPPVESDGTAGRPAGADPVDTAVHRAAAAAGLDAAALAQGPAPRLIPFSSDRKVMAAVRSEDGRLTARAKGAPRRILEMCDRVIAADGEAPLTDERRSDLLAVNASLAAQGLRVLALARGPVAEAAEPALVNLAFVGYLGLLDPPAPGVEEAIGSLRSAGLRTIMLTGDQRFTAEAIGTRLGVLAAGELRQPAAERAIAS